MQIPIIHTSKPTGQQEMAETREPMAFDCWEDAQSLAHKYSKKMKHDFWVLFAAKPHQYHRHAVVAGWEVIAKRPPAAMVGVLVFKWSHVDQALHVEEDLCLPFDIPLNHQELSTDNKDQFSTIADAAKKSNSILLA